MKLFSKKNKTTENVRRTAPKTKKPKIALNTNWLSPFLKMMAVSIVGTGLAFGVLALNQKLSVAYWDIEAEAHVHSQIESYFSEQQDLDFWHTRASVIQAGLMDRIPDIQYLEISRILPDGLLVKAQARTPIALWDNISANSPVMLIDEMGHAYRPLGRGENLDLPLLRLREDELGQAANLVLQLADIDATKGLMLSEVITEKQAWRLNFARGEQWQLSSASLEEDTKKVMDVLMQPRWANGHWRMDARIPQRWFIRPAKQEVI